MQCAAVFIFFLTACDTSCLADHADVSDEETVCKILGHKCRVDSVMIDGSSLSLSENTKWTKKMVRLTSLLTDRHVNTWSRTPTSTARQRYSQTLSRVMTDICSLTYSLVDNQKK